jgi:hypothetical protein
MKLLRNKLFKPTSTLRYDYTKLHVHQASEGVHHNVTLIPGYGVGK